MFISAKAYFDDNTPKLNALLMRMETDLPQEFVRLYKRNVVKLTPMKTGALRRSIITQAIGNTANIGWRSRYAKAQNEGGHTVPKAVRGPNTRDGGFSTINAGFYSYSRYTTAGTGPRFAQTAMSQTKRDMQAYLKQRGYTK